MALNARTRLIRALTCRAVDRPPVWFMRQAGRHLPEYRALRERWTFLDLCYRPEVCAEASCQPWKRYGMDAVIVFNDILIPLADMGMQLDFAPGPRFGELVTTPAAADALRTPSYAKTPPPVAAALRAIRATIGDDAGLLGFIGAPFTVAAYAVAGPSGQRQTALGDVLAPRQAALTALAQRLIDILADYAAAQVAAGADAIQVFESSAIDVPAEAYRTAGLPHYVAVLRALRERCPGTPIIAFGRGIAAHYAALAELADCISVDSSTTLVATRRMLAHCGHDVSLQGNLAGELLEGDPPAAVAAMDALLGDWRRVVPYPDRCTMQGPTGWVINLAHGIPATARPETVHAVVKRVRQFAV